MTGDGVAQALSFVIVVWYFFAGVLLVEMFTSIIVDNFADAEDAKRVEAHRLFK